MKTASEIRAEARAKMSGSGLPLILFVYSLVLGFIYGLSYIPIIGFFIYLAGALPLQYQFNIVALRVARGEQQNVENIFEPFKGGSNAIIRSLLACFLPGMFIFFWALLLIIPGYIKYYSYAMTQFIAHDNPEMGIMDCITKSREMMNGNKLRLFWLDCTFIGWFLTCIFIIPYYWVVPYFTLAHARFYEDLRDKDNKLQNMFNEPEAEVTGTQGLGI